MMLNGEQLNAIDIEKIVNTIFGDSQHSKRQLSLSNAALGVIASGSLIVHRMGLGLSQAKSLYGKHAIKQVDRLLSNEKLIVSDCFEKLVPYVVGARKEIIVTLDWTDFDKDNQTTISINLVTKHGRSTPLLWKTVKKSTLKNNRRGYEDGLLNQLKSCLVGDVKVTVLADRGFGDIERYQYLMGTLGFAFVIRFRGNISVTNEKGEMRRANDWVGVNGRSRTLRKAKVTAKRFSVPTVICVKDKAMKQSWCIAASSPTASARTLINFYAKRWGCETQFRGIPSKIHGTAHLLAKRA